MSLTRGTMLGSCEVIERIGTGGMGEVYRGRDTKLGREVAIKALPDNFAKDSDRLARFEREAQVLASLSHSNIGLIHELKEVNGSSYLILELVVGETLADRIARGPIPVEEALEIARQIAEALEAAHEKGIVHRDLKPANVKITPEGRVKVLDFGLAKINESADTRQNLSNSPTLSAMQTAQGMIFGTAAYMSPEQARGKTVNQRADVWAFGCVLYEMLTGRQAFPVGETVSDTLAAILVREPDWQLLPSTTPEKIRALMERCLRKDVGRRLRDIGDARIEIEDARNERSSIVATPAAVAAPSRRREFVFATIAAACLLIAVGVILRFAVFSNAVPETPPVRFDVAQPQNATFGLFFHLSPDGRTLAFMANVSGNGGTQYIWVRSIDSAEAHPLPGTQGVSGFFWSPDSQYIGFFTPGKLQKIAAAGGQPQVLSQAAGNYIGSWGAAGDILFGPGLGQNGPLHRVSSAGGELTDATELDSSLGETLHFFPHFLPDGRHFIFQSSKGRSFVGALNSKERRELPGIESAAEYSETGHLIFARNGSLMAQPFDAGRQELSGEAFPITELGIPANAPAGPYSISRNGDLAYRVLGQAGGETQLAWFDRSGKQIKSAGPSARYYNATLSPDSKNVAFQQGEPSDIWILDIERGVSTRFTSDAAAEGFVIWSPDGQRLVYASNREGVSNLYERAFGVVGEEKLLLKTPITKTPTNWSSDGRYVTYDSGGDVWALPMMGDGKPLRITQTPWGELAGRISPDGQWIAYLSAESAVVGAAPLQLYIQSFPQPGIKRQVSTNGAFQPRWSRDGKEILYIAPDSTLMTATVTSKGSTLEVGVPMSLFRTPLVPTALIGRRDWDVSADGKFLFNMTAANPTSVSAPPITVILNWARNLKK